MAPFTKPAFVSMLRRNMTHAPTVNRSLASKPAVMLQLSFSFASFSAVFLVRGLHVSWTLSVHGNSCTSEERRPSISLLKSLHAFLLGNRHTGGCPCFRSSMNLSAILSWTSHSWRVPTVSAVKQPQRTESNIAENLASFFWRSLMVSSSYVTSLQMLTDVAHPSLCCSDFEWCFQIQGVHWQAVAEDHP